MCVPPQLEIVNAGDRDKQRKEDDHTFLSLDDEEINPSLFAMKYFCIIRLARESLLIIRLAHMPSMKQCVWKRLRECRCSVGTPRSLTGFDGKVYAGFWRASKSEIRRSSAV